ncbi:flagellar hook-length control protein FliK [Thalassomonas viridans]|uniref:Flagellar hook-length control protein FliK n=1 Tax=Thalassomonas viridans TaxID=137584 RepID=A0AAE9Z2F8_9GAMM|nr:flagellar hook-length control protein FliK [Thalassomonas viridans]WDE03977.1 flagellar hook-length control protein FliK [Thalassomonas viridans]
MTQINFLPQELIKAADNKADNSGAEPGAQDRDDSFSSLVEQHTNADYRNRKDTQANKSGKPAVNESGKSAVHESGKETPQSTENTKGSEDAPLVDEGAKPAPDEAQELAAGTAEEGETGENSGPGSSGKPDNAKDPQHLIDLLGASAKLLQQQAMAANGAEHELAGDVNIDAELMEDGATEASVLAKLKGLVADVPRPTEAKALEVQSEGEAGDGEAPEVETLTAEQAAKQAGKAQTNSPEELLAKLKAVEGEAGEKGTAAGGSDKNLSHQEVKVKAQQPTASELKDKTAVVDGGGEAGEQSEEGISDEKPLTAVKPLASQHDNEAKKSIQLNKAGTDTAKTGATASQVQSPETHAPRKEADMELAVRDNPVAADSGAKAVTGPSQSGAAENHRPLGVAAEHGGQGTGNGGNSEQGKHAGSQGGQQASTDAAFAVKEETSQVLQHKVATNPLREQNTLAAQMNHSALANSETPQAHNSEHVLDSVAGKVNAENLQTQKNNLTTLNEALNLRKDFTGALKEKVMIMVNQRIQQVEIRLDPPELGNMHVRVNLQNEQAAVNFLVQNQQAKEALEQSMGKLKDMLSQSGVDVGDANVEQQQQGSGDNERGPGQNQQGRGRENHAFEQPELVMQASLAQVNASGVDYYA